MAVRVRPPPVLHSDPMTAWEEHAKARQKYDSALEVWRQSERLVNRNVQRTASFCHDTAVYASETAHHVRRTLAGADVGRMNIEKDFCEELKYGH